MIHYLRGDYSSALNELNQAANLDPELKGSFLNRGDLYYLTGNTAAALEDWKKIGQYDPLSEIASERLLYKIP